MGDEIIPYDFGIIGGGLSGLLSVYRMVQDPWYADKKMVVIETHADKANDRTWCYWEAGEGEWDALLHHHWKQAMVRSSEDEKVLALAPYSYKMLRSADFYAHVKSFLKGCDNVEWRVDHVQQLIEHPSYVEVVAASGTLRCKHILSSVVGLNAPMQPNRHRHLLQHFGGWFIQTDQPMWDDSVATLMDFSVVQLDGVCFMYVLPTSAHRALVEFTVFGPHAWSMDAYESLMADYLLQLGCTYTIVEKEMGAIPMTVYPFEGNNTPRITHIGSAGGWTRPSTGFTFQTSCRRSLDLIERLKNGQPPSSAWSNRHRTYDAVMLELMSEYPQKGVDFFMQIYKEQPIDRVFRFLDGHSSFWDELVIMWRARPRSTLTRYLFAWLLRSR
jgi:lycopene beta-cyclase